MTGKEFAEGLRSGKRLYGTGVVSPSPSWPPMIARLGFDFVFLDTEHIPFPYDTLSWMCRTYAALGMVPIVRIPEPDPYEACKVLDGGAMGIVAPYLETVDQMRALRGAVKLRPLKGARLQRYLTGESAIEPQLEAWLHARNENNLMIANIESVPAIEKLDELLAVPGLDGVFVGPHDLSASLGIPEQYTHPKFDAVARTIITKCRNANIGVGLHYSGGTDLEIAWARMGANLIIHSSDISSAEQAFKSDLSAIRGALKES
jgi:2-keto-3-deoxy-L-rhamnonate aldolase RhmA